MNLHFYWRRCIIHVIVLIRWTLRPTYECESVYHYRYAYVSQVYSGGISPSAKILMSCGTLITPEGIHPRSHLLVHSEEDWCFGSSCGPKSWYLMGSYVNQHGRCWLLILLNGWNHKRLLHKPECSILFRLKQSVSVFTNTKWLTLLLIPRMQYKNNWLLSNVCVPICNMK